MSSLLTPEIEDRTDVARQILTGKNPMTQPPRKSMAGRYSALEHEYASRGNIPLYQARKEMMEQRAEESRTIEQALEFYTREHTEL
jgi:hypothetical protein